jgi:SAM-dependent methyltransferase
MSAPMSTPAPTRDGQNGAYAMDNRHEAAAEHHQALSDLMDPGTRARIAGLVPELAGARCLEVGAGGGSVSCWLAEQVGDDGSVVASDLVPDRIPDHPRLTRVAHDLTVGPWPESMSGGFDLIVARMLLSHLPQRLQVVGRLVDRLAPGGVLLLEDWGLWREDMVVAAPDESAATLFASYQAAVRQVFDRAGNDRQWARQAYRVLGDQGLVDRQTVITAGYWPGGSPGTRLFRAVVRQLWPRLLAEGMTEPQLRQVLALLADERMVLHSHPLYSTSARRA